MTVSTAGGSPFALASEDRARLAERVAAAVRLARRERRRVIASVDVAIEAAVDVSAVVLASRGRDDRFFCLEQRDRGEFALATLGAAELVEAAGPRRFADAAAACRALGHGALTDTDGPRWVGGFAFAPDGGSSPEWASLAPAQLVLPEVVLW
ncbi:MAG: menaquinone-specific isochorismate synthase, partial [Thermoleophilales bacterium]|nr:menaquinone-specific isochorismate synthase [Thermoleophilales bacterium]